MVRRTKRVVIVLKQRGVNDPIHLIMPGGSKVLTVVKMTNKEINDAEDHGNTFLNLKLEEGG